MDLDDLTAEHRHVLHDSLKDGLGFTLAEASAQAFPERVRLGHAGAHTPQLALSDYLSPNAQAPGQVHRGLFNGYSNILANDTLGDCGEAMTLHGIEGMHHAAGTPIPAFTAQDAISLYETVGGYVPGDPSTDQGTDNDILVRDWQSTGVKCAADGSVHTIAGSVSVDSTNTLECQIAIWEFAALFCAYNMPVSAQGQTVWTVVGDGETGASAPGSWGGHDVVAMAYTQDTLDVNSWGQWIPVLADYRHAYAAGFFAVVSRDMLNRQGVSPSGLDWTALTTDLRKL